MANSLQVCWYAIGFFDILGQSRRLRHTSDLESAADDLNDTARSVQRLREFFRMSFEAFAPYQQENASRIVSWGMSDAYVVAVPMARPSTDGEKAAALTDVQALLGASASAWLAALADGFAIRGGVEIGPATPLGESEVYGTALAEAYYIEAKIAQAPRIVIGQRLERFLRNASQLQKHPDPDVAAAAERAGNCRALLREDHGLTLVDGLRPAVEGKSPAQCDVLEAALRHVRKEFDKHVQSEDLKLYSRYKPLLADLETACSKCRDRA